MGREKVYGTPGTVDLVVLKQRPECAWTILLIWQVLVLLLWPVSQGSPESPSCRLRIANHRDPDRSPISRRHDSVSISQPVQCGSDVG